MRVNARWLLVLLCLLLWPSRAHAQVIGPTGFDFTSADHNLSGLSGYQALLLLASEDAANGTVTKTGPVVPKANVQIKGGTPTVYAGTLAQFGVTPPACTVPQAQCPQYTIVLIAIGATGTPNSARGVASESDPFMASSSFLPPPLASPANVRVTP